MANGLTWRDVAPPDFQGSMAGYKIAGDAINNATKNMSDALDKFDADRKSNVANAIYQASMQYQDPAQLKAALADGSLYAKAGVNPELITADANKALESRASTLLGQSVTQTSLDHNKVMNPLLEANQAQSNAFDAANNPIRLKAAQQNVDQTGQNMSQSKTRFENEQASREEDINAKNFAEQAARGSSTYKDAMAALANTDMDGNTRAKALSMLPTLVKQYNPDSPDLPLPGSASAPKGAGAQGAGAAIAGAVAPTPAVGSGSFYSPSSAAALIRKVGGSEEEARTLGAIAHAESSGDPMAHNTNAKTGDNSYGLWQINMLGKMGPERLAHYGLKSNDELFNPETNARVALQMSRENKGYNDWSTYKNGKHEQYLSGANGGAVDPNSADNPNLRTANQAQNNQAAALISDAATRIAQNNASGVQGQYEKTQSDTTTSMGDAIKTLKAGSFKDVPDDVLRTRINGIITESKQKGRVPVTYATAAAILDNTASPDEAWIGGGFNPINWYRGTARNSLTSGGQAQSDELASIGQGDAQQIEKANTGHAAVAAALQSAVSAKNAAYNELMQAQENARTRPDVRATLGDKKLKYDQRAQEVDRLLKQATSDGTMGAVFKKPQG